MNVAFQGPNELISINEFSEHDDEEENQMDNKPISHNSTALNSPTINVLNQPN